MKLPIAISVLAESFDVGCGGRFKTMDPNIPSAHSFLSHYREIDSIYIGQVI